MGDSVTFAFPAADAAFLGAGFVATLAGAMVFGAAFAAAFFGGILENRARVAYESADAMELFIEG